jgi:DHA1 family tetracycline resistance protein-like MFS transporter
MLVMFLSSIALVIDERYGRGARDIGFLMTLIVILMIVLRGGFFNPLMDKLGSKKLLFYSVISGIFGFLVFPFLEQYWMLFLFMFPLVFLMVFVRPLINVNITRAVDVDQQGQVSGWSQTVQSLAETSIPLVSTGFLQIGFVMVGSVLVSPYFMIGASSAFLGIILLILIAIDIKKYPKAYAMKTAIKKSQMF